MCRCDVCSRVKHTDHPISKLICNNYTRLPKRRVMPRRKQNRPTRMKSDSEDGKDEERPGGISTPESDDNSGANDADDEDNAQDSDGGSPLSPQVARAVIEKMSNEHSVGIDMCSAASPGGVIEAALHASSPPQLSNLSPEVPMSIHCNSDQPLDLSLKARECLPVTTVSCVPKISMSPMEKSSLADLEKRFGGNSSLLRDDRNQTRFTNHSMFHQNAFTGFGGNIYTSALYNTRPKTSQSSVESRTRGHVSLRPHMTKSSSPPMPSVVMTKQCADAKVCISSDNGGKKHTNLACSCGRDFSTLYSLTVHLRETGHSAATGQTLVPERDGASPGVRPPDYPKLVRGQDMWLNHGCEQTAQILRCMQCGRSFNSLPELTVHMIDTRHYTNIVGPEMQRAPVQSTPPSGLLSCRVCCKQFADLDALTYHMVAANHHQRRARVDSSDSDSDSADSSAADGGLRHPAAQRGASTIRCVNCGEEKDTASFVEHVRVCVKGGVRRRPTEVLALSKMKTEPDSSSYRDTSPGRQLVSASGSQVGQASALSAMESFIAKSFVTKVPQLGNAVSHQPVAGATTVALPPSRPPKYVVPPTTEVTRSPPKYVHPMTTDVPRTPPKYVMPPGNDSPRRCVPKSEANGYRMEVQRPVEVTVKTERPDSDVEFKMTDNRPSPSPTTHSRSSAGRYLREKYLQAEGSDDKSMGSMTTGSAGRSALTSLQGLVYGRSLQSEHPLDSLQKLIRTTAAPAPPPNGHHHRSSMSSTLHQGTVILVNPIVTVVSGAESASGGPSVHINLPPVGTMSGSESDLATTTHSDSELSPTGGGDSHVSTTATARRHQSSGDVVSRCHACKRTFASKGSYRYHLSRCHMQSRRALGSAAAAAAVRDVFNKSPYVYLPLDHATKFNKYYEMANELANKGK